MGSFGISEGNITGRKIKPQIACLMAVLSSEVAQMLASATSKPGLNREVQATLLRVRTRPESLEGNMRELM